MAGSARRPGASPIAGEGFVDNGPGWPATSFSLKPGAHLVRDPPRSLQPGPRSWRFGLSHDFVIRIAPVVDDSR
ncbi:MAG: hypothetical protein CR217_06755 [Beijerinckiaceae bacterium]|nr:MAG: hypothetical protein CR217_06755 [Beijerinckiaceae bacterium]